MKIDLKIKRESMEPKAAYEVKATSYPTVYLSGLGDIDIEVGAEVMIMGVAKSVTKTTRNGKTTYSCDIEARSMDCDECEEEGDDGIDKAMKKIEKKKINKMMEDDGG